MISITIIKISKIIANGVIPNIIFLLFLLFSDISLLIARGKLRVQIVINNEKVGIIIMNSPIP